MPLLESTAFHGGSIQRGARSAGELGTEGVVKHPFPGVELEDQRDVAVVEIDEAAGLVAPADLLDVEQRGREACLARGVFEISERAGVFLAAGGAGEVQMAAGTDSLPRRDQPLVDRVELVGARGDDAPPDRLLEPGPLKHRRLKDRGRCIRIVFEQFRRTVAVEFQVEPAIEAAVVALPAFRNQVPKRVWNLEPPQMAFVADHATGELQAHRIDLAGRRFDGALDLVERERIIGALVPIALAVDGVEGEAALLGGLLPVVALGTHDALHVSAATREAMRKRAEAAARDTAGARIG